jgi:hypothetical protein
MISYKSHTPFIPMLSGTFGITAKLAHSPKMPKEPSSPSRSNARTERQCRIGQIGAESEQGQLTTMRIANRAMFRMLYFVLTCKTAETFVSAN